jgi:hypothetical protein
MSTALKKERDPFIWAVVTEGLKCKTYTKKVTEPGAKSDERNNAIRLPTLHWVIRMKSDRINCIV